jgi:predicted DNA binding CopG/RHH family protein
MASDTKPNERNVVLSVQIPETLRDALKVKAYQEQMDFPKYLRKLLREAVESPEKTVQG